MPRPTRQGPTLRRALSLGFALLIATLSCGREITGPAGARLSTDFSFQAVFAGGTMASAVASDLVPYTRVRLVLLRAGARVVVDEVVDFPSTAEELRIPVRIELLPDAPASGEQMDLLLRYINATNDTVFSGGPVPVTVAETRAGQEPPPPVQIPVDYTGPGSEATQVAISQTELTVVSGDAFALNAAAMTAESTPVPTAPIAWSSLDPALATITSPSAGNGVTLAGRGTARIVAALLNGPADTLSITVTPRAQSIAAVSGNDQQGASGAQLAQPVVVRVLATDNQPMAGVPITFAAANGGSVGTPSAVTDAAGLAQTTWTLGAALGAQTLTATSAGLTGSPVTFTAQAPTLQLLHHFPIEGSLEDAAGGADGVGVGSHSFADRVLSLDGQSGYGEMPAMLVPSSGSYSVSLFVRLDAPPSAPGIYISQGEFGGPGFWIGHNEGQLLVAEQWQTGVPAFGNDGLFHHMVLVVDTEADRTRLFVDGTLRSTLGAAILTGSTGSPTRLGAQYGTAGGHLAGAIDEVRIYAGALSDAQVAALHEFGASAPDRLVFGVQPSNVTAGATITPAVSVRREDAMGRLQTAFAGQVTLALGANPGDTELGGTTSVLASGGVAVFSELTVDTPAQGYTVVATTTGLASVQSTPFDVTAMPATALSFVVAPTNTFVGATMAPAIVIEALDAEGVPAVGYSGDVTITLGANPGGATLGGTLTVAAVNGLATFSDLTLNAAGAGYTLEASATGLTGVTSGPFDIVIAGANLVSWTNPAGGMWNTGANWSTGIVPTAGDSAVIALDGTYTVTLDANVTVGALTVGGGTGTRTLVAGPRTVTVAGPLTLLGNAGMTVDEGIVNGTGAFVNEGTLTFLGGTIALPLENRGLFVVQDVSSVSGSLTTTGGSTLRVQGAGGDGTGHLTVANTFTNNGAIELTSIGGGFTSQLSVTNGWLENAGTGTITSSVGAGGSRVLAAQLVNRGTVTTSAALTIARGSSSHSNELGGVIELAGANLTVTQSGTSPSFVNLGAITLASGRTLTVNGGTLNVASGTLAGGQGTLTTSGATVLLNTVGARVRLNLVSSTVPGTLTVPAGDSLVFVGGSPTMDLVNEGLVIVQDATTFNGTFTASEGSTLRLRGAGTYGTAALTVPGALLNDGAIEMTSIEGGFSASLTVAGGLTNTATGTISSLAGLGGARTIAAQILNQGLISTPAALTIARADAAHVNEGVIDVTTGNLTVTQTGVGAPSFSNIGSITLAGGRTMTVTGGQVNLQAGTLTGGTATLSISNATAAFTTTSARARLNLINTTVPGTFTVPAGDSIVLVGGSPTFTLVNEGLVIAQDAITINGSFTTTPGSTLRLRGAGTYGTAAATFTNALTNTGTIELTSIEGGFSASLTVAAGLTNAAGGTITSLVGLGGARTIAAPVTNEGAILLPAALTLARADAAHVNSGTIDVTGGNLTVTQTGVGAPSFSNTGVITLAGGRTMSVTGGQVTLTGGQVNGGTATLSTNNATLAFTTPEARTRLNLINTTVPGTFTVPAGDSIVLVGGSPTFTLVNEGLVIAQDAITINGTFTTTAASTLRLRGAGTYGTAAATFTSALTNTGTIELTSIEGGFSASLTVAGGLTNAAGGTITSLVGLGGARTIAAPLDNQGAILLPAALTLARADAAHVNSGTIDVTGGNLTVTQTGVGAPSFSNTGVITLSGGRTMSVTGGQLTLTGGQVNGGTATLSTSNATLAFTTPEARTRLNLVNTTVPGTFTVPAGDSIVLVGGSPTMTLVNEGTIIAQDALTFSGSLTTATPASTLRLRGAGTYGTSAFTYNGTLTNSGIIDLTSIEGGFSASLTATGGLVNTTSGVINALTGLGGARTLAAQLDNQGIINTPAALTIARASAAHVNSGSINVTTGNLTVTQSGTAPSFANLPGGAINLTAGRTMTVTGGALDLTQGLLAGGAATLSTNGTTLSFTIPTAVTRFNLVSTVVPHTVVVPQSDSLVMVGGALNAPIDNNGLVLIQDAVTLGGAINTLPGSTIRVRGAPTYGTGALTVTNGFTNTQRIELTSFSGGFSSSLAVTNGTLTNAPDGIIEVLPGAGGARTLAAELDNQGTLSIHVALSLARASSAHVNSGTIQTTNGNITVTQSGTAPSFTNTGSILLPSDRVLAFSGGSVDLTAGLVDGSGATVSTNGSTLSFTIPTVRARLALTATTVPHTVAVPTGELLHLVGGTLGAPVVNDGTILVNDAMTLSGAITNNAGATIRVQGAAVFGTATLTATNGFTNSGLVELTSANGSASAMVITTGALTNAAGGTLSVVAGPGGGSRTLTGALIDNLGTFAVGTALTANTALDQRNIMNVTAGTTTVNGASTFHDGSVTTLTGTGAIVKAGGCTNSGGTGNGSVCP